MFSLWELSGLALGYVLVLFVIAWLGDRAARQRKHTFQNAWVYSLGLGVYCTSWTFYGAVGEAAQNGWNYLPIYLGPILTVLLGGSLIYKMVSVAQQNHITSIADFLAARYGKSRRLAVLVTLVAVIGVLPYIALQLKAVTLSFDYVLKDNSPAQMDTALMVAILMALFTLLFGTRHIDATEHQSGLMLAVSFESFIKVVAFVMIGLYCLFGLFDGPVDLWQALSERQDVMQTFEQHSDDLGYAFLLLRYVDDPRNATEEQIVMAANDTVPHVWPMFWAFRIMVGIGMALILINGYFFVRSSFKGMDYPRWALRLSVAAIPLPWIAAEMGWIVAEYGRQPWTVDGILPTALSVSHLSVTQLLLTIAGFALFYTVLFVVEMGLMIKYIKKGPTQDVAVTDEWMAKHEHRLRTHDGNVPEFTPAE